MDSTHTYHSTIVRLERPNGLAYGVALRPT